MLAGFGMRTAIRSGFLAAKSILENTDYQELADEEFAKYMKAGVVNRYVWEHKHFDNYITLLKKINEKNHSVDSLKSMYNFNLLERIEYPAALDYVKEQYPEML